MNIREPQQFKVYREELKKRHVRLVALLAFGCWVSVGFVLIGLSAANHMAAIQAVSKPLTLEKPTAKQVTASAPAAKPFEFPKGGETLNSGYRFVALYGSPDMPALGVLGEQSIADSVTLVKDLTAQYQAVTTDYIYPTFEIIATVASEGPTDNGDYSQELGISKLQPWIDAAKQSGVYVLLDLQPGRGDFLSQAKLYEPLLKQPHVGLALDPEWRLAPDQTHMQQIGSVGIDEINQTSGWLADLTRTNKLPQKLFVVHQFMLSMIQERERFDATRSELAYVIQMDGHGSQQAKLDTWNAILQGAPTNTNFGWKNFYDEDQPMLDPASTMVITPQPYYISYQ